MEGYQKAQIMIEKGIIHPLVTRPMNDSNAELLAKVSGNADGKIGFKGIIGDTGKQPQLDPLLEMKAAGGALTMFILRYWRVLTNTPAMLGEVFLHHKYGVRASNPLNTISGFFLALFAGALAFGMVLAVTLGITWIASNFSVSGFLTFQKHYYYGSGFVLIAVFVWSFHFLGAWLNEHKGKHRHSYSNGIPWIYSVTRWRIFLSPLYMRWGEPLLLICLGVFLINYSLFVDSFISVRALDITASDVIFYYSATGVGSVVMVSGFALFLRNYFDHQVTKDHIRDSEDQIIMGAYNQALSEGYREQFEGAIKEGKQDLEAGKRMPQNVEYFLKNAVVAQEL